jgi:hypothetical protein
MLGALGAVALKLIPSQQCTIFRGGIKCDQHVSPSQLAEYLGNLIVHTSFLSTIIGALTKYKFLNNGV